MGVGIDPDGMQAPILEMGLVQGHGKFLIDGVSVSIEIDIGDSAKRLQGLRSPQSQTLYLLFYFRAV